ncbi:MAG TPA: DUF883 family protein [Verrucomicrobiae bacterium]|jgi:ElaB/YqjD/DUF883 family membrane-anchored ribosome-binding protein
MSKHNHQGHRQHSAAQQETTDLATISEDAQELLAATAGLAEDKVVQARKRLSDSLASVRDSVVENAKSVDQAVRDNPYKAIGAAAGVGVVIGVLIGLRSSLKD